MLVHPWDAALDEDEWRNWLRQGRDFGQLIAVDGEWPMIIPTHFVLDELTVLVHLARANPVWPLLEATGRVVLSVVDDYAFIPSYWRAGLQGSEAEGVPTSYYSAVQLQCRVELIDDPVDKAALLVKQLQHFQPEGRYAAPSSDGTHARLLPGIRGARLTVLQALAKFKFDDHKPEDLRHDIAGRLQARGQGRDASASRQQQQRIRSDGPVTGLRHEGRATNPVLSSDTNPQSR
jgi:transcriptional regulator